QSGLVGGWREDAVEEVLVGERRADARRVDVVTGSGEALGELVGLVPLEELGQYGHLIDVTPLATAAASCALKRDALDRLAALLTRELRLDVQDARGEIDVLPEQSERLADAQAREAEERHERLMRFGRAGDQLRAVRVGDHAGRLLRPLPRAL